MAATAMAVNTRLQLADPIADWIGSADMAVLRDEAAETLPSAHEAQVL